MHTSLHIRSSYSTTRRFVPHPGIQEGCVASPLRHRRVDPRRTLMMTVANQPTEVEAKFTVADPALLHELTKPKTAVPGYRFGDVRTREVRDLYLDTPDYWLLRRGFQLRVRTGEDQWLATLKSRGMASVEGIYHRLEIEEAL